MEAKELRVGNIINAAVTNGIETVTIYEVRVFEILKDGIRDINGLKFGFDNLIGIPLTEEWMLKFGFENNEDEKYNPNDEYADQFQYTLNSGISHREFICRPYKGWFVKMGDYDDELEVKYVNEFQNLFFALTGKELTLKEN